MDKEALSSMNEKFPRNAALGVVFAIACLLLFPTWALAHVDVGPTAGLWHGLSHPLTGLDHLAAMVAVGLWAAQRGGRAIWFVPLAFVVVMTFGAILGMWAVSIPLVEPGIVASVLVLGVLIAAAARLPLAASVMVVSLFALFHGHAHGAEMPATASGLAYGASFLAATICLHLFGIGLGTAAQRFGMARLVRCGGVAVAVCGLYLCLV
jgi:urease accessory protein